MLCRIANPIAVRCRPQSPKQAGAYLPYDTRPALKVKADLVRRPPDYVVLPALQKPQLPRTVELAGMLFGSYSIPLKCRTVKRRKVTQKWGAYAASYECTHRYLSTKPG